MNRSILMPVRTVADWGGVHEWSIDAASALISEGHSVTFVGSGDLFEQRARATGAGFLKLDWASWEFFVPSLLESPEVRDSDLIFAHAPEARMLALELSKRIGTEVVVMVHGAYHDHMYSWSHLVSGILAASPSLVHFCQRFGRVEPWKVYCVPNAASDSLFHREVVPFEARIADGVARITTAARLSHDKTPQIDAALEAMSIGAELRPDLKWKLDVFGDGPARPTFEAEYRAGLSGISGAEVQFHGWVPPEAMPEIMRTSVLCVAAGMGAVRCVAAGTLCVGSGARNNVGLQVHTNLRAGIWSNFGDHGVMRFRPTSVAADLRGLLRQDDYENAVTVNRDVLRRTHSQSVVDGAMISALGC